MCVVSMVQDQFRPIIPRPVWPYSLPIKTTPWSPQPIKPIVYPWTPPMASEALDELLRKYNKMLNLAEEVDDLTGQPDCEDPEKATLRERVAELERRLDDLEDLVG